MINILKNNSQSCYRIKAFLEESKTDFNVLENNSTKGVIFNIEDNLLKENIAFGKNIINIFYLWDTIIVFLGIYNVAELEGMIYKTKKQADNTLSVFYDVKFPFKISDTNDKFILNFIKVFNDKKNLYKISPKIQLYNLKTDEFIQYKIINYDNPISHENTDSNGDRKYNINYFDQLYNKYCARAGGIFFHQYNDYRSTYIPAFGTELKVNKNYTETGYGRAYQRSKAKTLSSIEAIERIAGMSNETEKNKVIYGSYSKLNSKYNIIDPRKLILHSQTEYKNMNYNLKRYSDELEYNWIEGISLKNGKKIFLPEQSIHFGEQKAKIENNCFLYETSNGAATGGTLEEAILYALYEIIERDNFLVNWYCKFECKEIDINSTSLKYLRNLVYILKEQDIEIKLYDISMELGIPSVWAMMFTNSPNYKIKAYNAAGCNLNPEKAVESALFEVITSFPIYNYLLKSDDKIIDRAKFVVRNKKNVTEFQDHVLYYSSEKNFDILKFPQKNNYSNDIHDIYFDYYKNRDKKLNDKLKYIIEKILLYYEDIYYIDITPKYIKKDNLYCVKVIVPGMLPMTFGQQYKRINKIRLENEWKRRKIKGLLKVNDEPHPFP